MILTARPPSDDPSARTRCDECGASIGPHPRGGWSRPQYWSAAHNKAFCGPDCSLRAHRRGYGAPGGENVLVASLVAPGGSR